MKKMINRCEVEKMHGVNDELVHVRMNLTNGELLALQNMLRAHQTAVQSDVCALFANALIRANIDPQKL